MIKRVLAGLSGTEYTPISVETAVDLAKRHDAEVTGVTIFNAEKLRLIGSVPIGAGAVANEFREHLVAKARERLEASVQTFEQACREAGVTHTVLREEREEFFDYLASQSRYHDLTILGLKGVFDHKSPLDEADRTAMITSLIESGVRPIVAVPKTPFTVRKVMIAYSGSAESSKTMRRFVQLLPWGHTPLHIVTFQHTAARAENLLVQAAAYCRAHGFEVETAHVDRRPQDALLTEADECGADLIVLGNSTKRLLLRRVLGETCLMAIKHSTKPLFLCQ